MKAKDWWLEFVVDVTIDAIGMKVPICGLCGNTGLIDTTATAKCDGKCVGVLAFCICPNGRARKKPKKK